MEHLIPLKRYNTALNLAWDHLKWTEKKNKSPLCLWSLLVSYFSSIGTCIQLRENNYFCCLLSSYLLYPIFSFPFEHFHFLPQILGSESMLCIFLGDHIHALSCLAGSCQADYLIVIFYFLFSRGLNFKIFFVPGAGLHEKASCASINLSWNLPWVQSVEVKILTAKKQRSHLCWKKEALKIIILMVFPVLVAKTLSMIFENLCQSGEGPSDWKKKQHCTHF